MSQPIPSTPSPAAPERAAGSAAPTLRAPYGLGPLPLDRKMITVDEALVAAPIQRIFDLARRVEEWPEHLPHYRFVRFRARTRDGGGLVEMSANRPFGPLNWPTWWLSQMRVDTDAPTVRYRHVEGITTAMDVEWNFARVHTPEGERTRVRVVHVWDGPSWPLISTLAAVAVIGPVFVHGIASRTLAGLQRVAERG
jgi:ribosome-associated toxin RatA of RatAB toxin-antitoxin module